MSLWEKIDSVISNMVEPDERESKKSRLIADIIVTRKFDVTKQFIDSFVNYDTVIYLLTMDIKPGYPYSSVQSFNVGFEKDELDNFLKFMDYVIEEKHIVNVKHPKIMKALTLAQAIYLLKPEHWKRFLKYKRKSLDDFVSWMIYAVESFTYLSKSIPRALLDELRNYNDRGLYAYIMENESINIDVLQNIVKSMDISHILSHNIWALTKCWELGGTVFPTSIDALQRLLPDSSDDYIYTKYYIGMYEENTRKQRVSKPIEYYLYKLREGDDKNSPYIYNTVHEGNISYVGIYSWADPRRLLDDLDEGLLMHILGTSAIYDVNSLSVMTDAADTPERLENLQSMMNADDVKSFLNTLIRGRSDVPLKDFRLYHELTGSWGSVEDRENFIKLGGRPQSLLDVPRSVNHQCYSVEGVKLILTYSDGNDILEMITTNEEFVEYLDDMLKSVPDVSAVGITRLIKLLSSISDIKRMDVTKSVRRIAFKLIYLIGKERAVTTVPKSILWIPSDPYVKTNYAEISYMIKNVGKSIGNFAAAQYMPIEYIPKDILERYMLSSGFAKINSSSCSLDDIFTLDELCDLLHNHGKIQYIPDLSYATALEYIDRIIDDDFQ